MNNKLKAFLFFICLGWSAYAQTGDSTSLQSTTSAFNTTSVSSLDQPDELTKPTIGLGPGMFSFYGDLYSKHFQLPTVSRIAYELYFDQPINKYFSLNFNVLRGNLGANERFVPGGRNLNFESRIFLGGVNVLYNFGNLLPDDREATPFLSLGFSTFNFISKTDLFDSHGNRYYYWSDNTIRDMSETDPLAENAIEIKRDYIYETDIKKLNLDKVKDYPEQSFAIPISAGVNFKINDYLNFKVGATMYLTLTDHIDGVTSKGTGVREGNKGNDKFMMTSFGLSYNFGFKKKGPADENPYLQNVDNVDFLALENEDQDGDGVIDFKDSCNGTPAGAPVDLKGCPLDDDEDGVPNYKDVELATRVDAFVDEEGKELTDSIIAYRYNFFMDSIGAYAKVEVHDHNGALVRNKYTEKDYTVELGIFKTGLPPDLMTKFLSIDDISTTVLDDSTTVYTAGSFTSRQDAETRKDELNKSGLNNIKVVYKQRGKFHDPDDDIPALTKTGGITPKTTTTKEGETGTTTASNKPVKKQNIYRDPATARRNITPGEVKTPGNVFRVQLGAYRRPLSKNIFPEVNDLIEVKTEDSLYKYMTGTFKTLEAAAKHKARMLMNGYEGAFITAYKDGERVSLRKAGAAPITKDDEIKEVPDNQPISGVTKKLVVYRIQVGAFKNSSISQQAKFEKIKTTKVSAKGFNRYLTGEFADYESAAKYKNELLQNKTVEEAFVIAYFNGRIITLAEAAELLKN
ncbi:MAG TPA: DUF6089 family protein [Bacteroidia bacterium]|jgi:cell division protein FtsN|nr:DUF6089 family protein [Bacteroidia bacterium]